MSDWNRRDLLGAIAGVAVSGCSQSTYQLVKDSFGHSGRKGYPATPDQIAALPYATLGVSIGGAAPAVMVLAENRDSNLLWSSSDRVVFVTRGGRLTKTAGLSRDLSNTQFLENDPIANPPAQWPQAPIEILRVIDLRNPDDIGQLAYSHLQVADHEEIQILGKTRQTLRIEERVIVEKWRWTTLNKYWIGVEDRRVWRSSFRFCPEIPEIRLELLKPAI